MSIGSELRQLAAPLEGSHYAFMYSEHPTPRDHRYRFQHTTVYSYGEAYNEIQKCIVLLQREQEAANAAQQ